MNKTVLECILESKHTLTSSNAYNTHAHRDPILSIPSVRAVNNN